MAIAVTCSQCSLYQGPIVVGQHTESTVEVFLQVSGSNRDMCERYAIKTMP
jgi:hypothetical protein